MFEGHNKVIALLYVHHLEQCRVKILITPLMRIARGRLSEQSDIKDKHSFRPKKRQC